VRRRGRRKDGRKREGGGGREDGRMEGGGGRREDLPEAKPTRMV
jgi:hypothetical protein